MGRFLLKSYTLPFLFSLEACTSPHNILVTVESAQLSEGAPQFQKELQMVTLRKSIRTVIPIQANGSPQLVAHR